MSLDTGLPAMADDIALDPALVEAYRRDGHACVRGLCRPDEMAVYSGVIMDAAMRHNTETRPMEERDTYGKAFLQIMNLWTVDAGVKRFVFAKRFASVAARLLGVEKVRLYHDQALFKEPGGGVTPWHQDQFYWPLDTDQTITMWMPLVDVDAVMGTMSFADGSQTAGFVPVTTEISDASETFFEGYVREKGYSVTSAGAMAAGDATFHSGWTLHKAPGNTTDRVRAAITVIYYPDGTLVGEPKNDFQKADHRVWLGSIAPGQVADGPLNPVLN